MIEKHVVSQVLEYSFYDQISDFSSYKDFFDDLRQLKESDELILKINSPGGRVDVGLMVVDAIKNCKARVTGVVTHQAASMGALIALACNNLVMNKHTYLMFHDYSGISFGKGSALEQQFASNNKMWHSRFNSICRPFLTERESKLILEGKDLYIHADCKTLQKRIKRHFK